MKVKHVRISIKLPSNDVKKMLNEEAGKLGISQEEAGGKAVLAWIKAKRNPARKAAERKSE